VTAALRIALTGAAEPFARELAAGLAAAGARLCAIAEAMDAPDAARRALDRASRELGGLDALVHAEVPALALELRELMQTDAARWDGACEALLRAALFALQAAHPQLRERGGRVVLIAPTHSQSGAARLVPYAAAAEALRALAKSASAQWRAQRISVNCLAPSLDALRDPIGWGVRGELAAPLHFLASPAASAVVGVSLRVDRGQWLGS